MFDEGDKDEAIPQEELNTHRERTDNKVGGEENKPPAERYLRKDEIDNGIRDLIGIFDELKKEPEKRNNQNKEIRGDWDLKIERGSWFLTSEDEHYRYSITFDRNEHQFFFSEQDKYGFSSRSLIVWNNHKPYPDSDKKMTGFEYTEKERENIAPTGKPVELGGLYGRPHKDTNIALEKGLKLISKIIYK